MSLVNIMAALEEFEEEVSADIAPEQPTDGGFDEETAGVNYPEESDDIDSDIDSITASAKGLEDIISLVNEAPGEDDAPMEPFVEKAVNVALESNDVVASAGNPLAATADKGGVPETKGGALDKIKAFAAKVWEMLRNFGKRIAAWIRETWAKYTDRIVKNSTAAKKVIEECANLADRSGAKIVNKVILAKITTFKNAEVGEVLLAVTEHAADQAGKDSIGITKAARQCIDIIAGGASTAEGQMKSFLDAIVQTGRSYHEKASPQQAQAIKAAAGTETFLSEPFFGGYRAWTTIPENEEALAHWNHGITKVDEVKVPDSIDAPNAELIKAVAEHIVAMGALVSTYQANIKLLDDLNKDLDKAASKAKNAKSESPQLKAMNAVIPRVVKGPQVAAYAYAVSAGTAALQYCLAGIEAHKSDSDVKSGMDQAKDKASATADKVKGAFARKDKAE